MVKNGRTWHTIVSPLHPFITSLMLKKQPAKGNPSYEPRIATIFFKLKQRFNGKWSRRCRMGKIHDPHVPKHLQNGAYLVTHYEFANRDKIFAHKNVKTPFETTPLARTHTNKLLSLRQLTMSFKFHIQKHSKTLRKTKTKGKSGFWLHHNYYTKYLWHPFSYIPQLLRLCYSPKKKKKAFLYKIAETLLD